MTKSSLLLTGASGLVGGTLLPLLSAANPERHIFLLSRSPHSLALGNPNITVIGGDLTLPELGLTAADYRAVTQSVSEIIHCAADIRFRAPIEESREVNVAGTARLLSLARHCDHFDKFAHISTVYVAGKTPGITREEKLIATDGFLNAYQQSKHEAEQIVFDAMSDFPASIFRLSSIVSDSQGAVRQFNYFHRVLKLAPRQPLPIIPGAADAPLDLIASDWAASAIATIFDHHFTPGRVHHVCAGADGSMTLAEILDRTFQVLNRRTRNSFAPPRLVATEEFEAFARGQERGSNENLKALLRVMSEFLPQLAIPQSYENKETLSLLSAVGLPLPPIRDYYAKIVEHCFA